MQWKYEPDEANFNYMEGKLEFIFEENCVLILSIIIFFITYYWIQLAAIYRESGVSILESIFTGLLATCSLLSGPGQS